MNLPLDENQVLPPHVKVDRFAAKGRFSQRTAGSEVNQGRGLARVPSVPRGFRWPPGLRPVIAQRTQGRVRTSVDFGRLLIKVRFSSAYHAQTVDFGRLVPGAVDFCTQRYLAFRFLTHRNHSAQSVHLAFMDS